MSATGVHLIRAILIWAAVAGLVIVPVVVAAGSEFLQYREGIYIAGGMAGVVALGLLLVQPLLAAGLLPGVSQRLGRRVHRMIGAALVLSIAVHVAGLWVTSPPDMIDALTFSAPTAFSVFGVVAMWALIGVAGLAGFRRRLPIRPMVWRLAHSAAASVVVLASLVHALLIVGTMGQVSKAVLCLALIAALALAVGRMRPWVGVRSGAKVRD